METVGGRSVGMSVKRVEDPRILSGKGRYLDDVILPGMLHAAFLRSAVPHGRLLSVDAGEARALPGVVAVYTGEDLKGLTEPVVGGAVSGFNMIPGMALPTFYALATDKVRHVGDPIALVVAESRRVAEDAVELVVEDIEHARRRRHLRRRRRPGQAAALRGARRTTSTSRCPRPSGTSTPRSPRPTGSCGPPSRSTATPRCRWRAGARSPAGTPRPRSSRSAPRRSPRTCTAWRCRPRSASRWSTSGS